MQMDKTKVNLLSTYWLSPKYILTESELTSIKPFQLTLSVVLLELLSVPSPIKGEELETSFRRKKSCYKNANQVKKIKLCPGC